MCLATGAAPAPVAAGEREPLSNSSSASERTVLAVPISLPDAEVILQAPKLKGHRRNSSHGRLIDEWDNLLGGHAGVVRPPSPDNCMVCRICEERVDLRWAEQHTRCCVTLSRCKQDALACHEPLRKLSIVLVDKVAERHRLRQLSTPAATIVAARRHASPPVTPCPWCAPAEGPIAEEAGRTEFVCTTNTPPALECPTTHSTRGQCNRYSRIVHHGPGKVP